MRVNDHSPAVWSHGFMQECKLIVFVYLASEKPLSGNYLKTVGYSREIQNVALAQNTATM